MEQNQGATTGAGLKLAEFVCQNWPFFQVDRDNGLGTRREGKLVPTPTGSNVFTPVTHEFADADELFVQGVAQGFVGD